MQAAISKLTKKYQATVPASIREELSLSAGDSIAFELSNGEVRLKKASPMDIEFAAALVPTLSEWDSDNDEEAYSDL
jgi:antitoxin PrlF